MLLFNKQPHRNLPKLFQSINKDSFTDTYNHTSYASLQTLVNQHTLDIKDINDGRILVDVLQKDCPELAHTINNYINLNYVFKDAKIAYISSMNLNTDVRWLLKIYKDRNINNKSVYIPLYLLTLNINEFNKLLDTQVDLINTSSVETYYDTDNISDIRVLDNFLEMLSYTNYKLYNYLYSLPKSKNSNLYSLLDLEFELMKMKNKT